MITFRGGKIDHLHPHSARGCTCYKRHIWPIMFGSPNVASHGPRPKLLDITGLTYHCHFVLHCRFAFHCFVLSVSTCDLGHPVNLCHPVIYYAITFN